MTPRRTTAVKKKNYNDAHIKKLLVIDKSGKILDFLSKKR